MDINADQETNVSIVVNVGDPEAELNGVDLLDGILSNGEVITELGNVGEVVSRVELDIACSSEKLVNLDILMLHVATRENDFEVFASEREHMLADSAQKALEFDLLSGILDSEVRELDKLMTALEADIINARELMSSYGHLGRISLEMEEKLLDSENSLKQSQEQISEIKMQSAKFHRTVSCIDGEQNWNGDKETCFSEHGQLLNVNQKIKMQTAEQQRHILRMLEKSLAREMDLEKNLAESRQMNEELKSRLTSFERDVFYMEEEATNVCERLFEAENAAEVLLGISKELVGRLQLVQFYLNGSLQRETDLRLKLNGFMEQLEVKENALQKLENSNEKLNDLLLAQTDSSKASIREAEDKLILLNSENFTLRQKVDALEKQLKEEQNKVDSLERQWRESDFRLQHAVASAEASQEKQNMLYSSIRDMENLIEDLKLKVSKADNRADTAEEKLIVLSEANAGLTEELSFLRDRLECLEASLHQVEETKLATAKDIGIETKVITNLVMRLAIERERLHQQMSSLTLENKAMTLKLQQTNRDSAMNDLTTARESKEVTELSAAVSELDETEKNAFVGETDAGSTDLTSELGTVRRIDAWLLNYNHVFIAFFIVLISAAAYFCMKQNSLF